MLSKAVSNEQAFTKFYLVLLNATRKAVFNGGFTFHTLTMAFCVQFNQYSAISGFSRLFVVCKGITWRCQHLFFLIGFSISLIEESLGHAVKDVVF